MSAVPAQPAVEPVAIPRALARRLALPVVFAVATVYHFLQSRGHATPTVFNDELLYAKLSQSTRGRPRARDSRRALLLPRTARAARAGAGVAARLDDGRVRGREAAERGDHVGGRLPGVLARPAGRAPVVRIAHRSRGSRDAGDGLPRLPHVGGAGVSGLPLRRRSACARSGEAVDRGAGHVRTCDRNARAVPRPAARLSRRSGRVRARELSPSPAAGRADRTARRRARRHPGRARTVRRGDAHRPRPWCDRALGADRPATCFRSRSGSPSCPARSSGSSSRGGSRSA